MIYKFRRYGYCIISGCHILVHNKSIIDNRYSEGVKLNIKETKDSMFAFDNNCVVKIRKQFIVNKHV